jgi:putative ABC transport system substrate-binding protein
MLGLRRREFVTLLGGAAASPLAASAQQDGRVRRVGVLAAGDENDSQSKSNVAAFTQALAGLGWTDGRNVRMELRWGLGDNNRMRALAQELVGSQPDIIVVSSIPATIAVQRETRTIPIVFAERERPRRQRHRRAARPPEWKHHRLRHQRSHAGWQVA